MAARLSRKRLPRYPLNFKVKAVRLTQIPGMEVQAGGQGRAESVSGEAKPMRRRYDFSQARKSPHAARLKKQITLCMDQPTIQLFRESSESSGIPCQTLINLYLGDCAQQGRNLSIEWRASSQGA